MLSREEVLRIAELAKIQIKEEDIEGYQKDLSAILDFIGTLAKLPEREETDHKQMMGLEGELREDSEHTEGELPKGQALIKSAHKHKDGFVKTPRILKMEDNE